MAEPNTTRAHARPHAPKHARRGSRWRLVAVPLGGLSLVLALTLVVTGQPGAQPSTPTLAAQTTALDVSSAPAPLCGVLGALGHLLGACQTTDATNATAASTSCNLVAQLLGQCAQTPSGGGDAADAAPPTTSTTTTTSPPPPPTTPVVDPTASASGPCSGSAPPVAAPSGGWHCTLDDEFNGTSLDTSIWSPMTTYGSGYRTGPLFNQVCYVDDPQTISESGGTLNLSVYQSAKPYSCKATLGAFQTNDLGGMVDSYQKFSQQYGFFEARASMPPVDFPGLQETLWLYPENETLYGRWPDSGEIDYGEFYSNYSNLDVPAVHYPGSEHDPNAQTNCSIPGQSPIGQFHTYALMWTPTSMTSYYDGMPCMTDVYAPYVANPDTAPEPFNQPFFLNFTAAFGSANGDQYRPNKTPLPDTMQVDWMRVWQYG